MQHFVIVGGGVAGHQAAPAIVAAKPDAASKSYPEGGAAARPISNGVSLEGREVECPLHGARFNVETGELLQGPAECGLKTLSVRVNGGDISEDGANPDPVRRFLDR